jgi:hypothetical protein
MRVGAIIVGTLITVSGLVWMLQGMGSTLAPQSFMTNAAEWIAIGAVTATGGTALVIWALRKR